MAGTLGYVVNGWSVTSAEHDSFGFVYLPAVLLISMTSSVTAPYGARLAHKLPVASLKKMFAVLLIILSLKMLFSVLPVSF
ncbi:TSUP family transporter [Methylomarinum sp. Ch1-1]|uniref:Probable membrane transporter protein n=1 Tax=Methylomarinum roseum TaxID=3067653 RepID=A0AAU7NZU8_9GAMM|nr:TSUP family transporter [Methylomarinum sp. Ch1-1]MDP4521448.1 TSUP family transporter [Methylomarinum sp. Ch1-1]